MVFDPFISGAIIAVTEAIKKVLPDKVEGVVVIIVAALLGVGFALYQGADLVQGALNGLVASGIVTVASRIGK